MGAFGCIWVKPSLFPDPMDRGLRRGAAWNTRGFPGRYRIFYFSWGLLVFSLLGVCDKKKRGSLKIEGREKIGTYVNRAWSLWGERDL
jgi:hypothetical protein